MEYNSSLANATAAAVAAGKADPAVSAAMMPGPMAAAEAVKAAGCRMEIEYKEVVTEVERGLLTAVIIASSAFFACLTCCALVVRCCLLPKLRRVNRKLERRYTATRKTDSTFSSALSATTPHPEHDLSSGACADALEVRGEGGRAGMERARVRGAAGGGDGVEVGEMRRAEPPASAPSATAGMSTPGPKRPTRSGIIAGSKAESSPSSLLTSDDDAPPTKTISPNATEGAASSGAPDGADDVGDEVREQLEEAWARAEAAQQAVHARIAAEVEESIRVEPPLVPSPLRTKAPPSAACGSSDDKPTLAASNSHAALDGSSRSQRRAERRTLAPIGSHADLATPPGIGVAAIGAARPTLAPRVAIGSRAKLAPIGAAAPRPPPQ